MRSVDVVLKPIWDGKKTGFMEVNLKLRDNIIEKGEMMFERNSFTVIKPFLTLDKDFNIEDEQGIIPVDRETFKEDKVEKERFIAERETKGDINVNYRCIIEPVGVNPVFDLGYEEKGINGSGLSFMPYLKKGKYQCCLQWDMSEMPEGTIGVWSYGEGEVDCEIDGDGLAETLYCAGSLKKVKADGCGVYWIHDDGLPGEEIGDFITNLFTQMADFFNDQNPVYQVFVRRLPMSVSEGKGLGGTALKRAFELVYNQDNPPNITQMKILLTHEMVHNWAKMKDEPFGTCTWFVEGAAEYYSLILPERYGLLEHSELVDELNKRSKAYFENPKRQITNKQAGKLLFKDEDATHVPYGRGFFYFLKMDDFIRTSTNGEYSIDDVILKIVEERSKGNEVGNDFWLETVESLTRQDITQEFKNMQSGELFEPVVTSFQTQLGMKEINSKTRGTDEPCISYQFFRRKLTHMTKEKKMSPEERIRQLGLKLPATSEPKALYVPVKQAGNVLYISGQVPFVDDALPYVGKVGGQVTMEQAQEAAKVCILNMLAAVKYHVGELDTIKNVVKIQTFVNSVVGFDKQHLVANAASRLLHEVFGEAGRHARTAIGTNQLPLDVPVEIEGIFEV